LSLQDEQSMRQLHIAHAQPVCSASAWHSAFLEHSRETARHVVVPSMNHSLTNARACDTHVSAVVLSLRSSEPPPLPHAVRWCSREVTRHVEVGATVTCTRDTGLYNHTKPSAACCTTKCGGVPDE
jgi:hypothetical protein